jgi:hypothetical protein
MICIYIPSIFPRLTTQQMKTEFITNTLNEAHLYIGSILHHITQFSAGVTALKNNLFSPYLINITSLELAYEKVSALNFFKLSASV